MRLSVGIVMLVSLAACDSDNVHYQVSSNPSGTNGAGGTTIVIVGHSATLASERNERVVHLQGADTDGEGLRVYMPAGQDMVVLEREHALEVRSTLLSSQPLTFPGATVELVIEGPVSLRLHLLDSSVIDSALQGPGTLQVHALEPVLTLEHGGGNLRFESTEPAPHITAPQPQTSPGPFMIVQATGNRYVLRLETSR